MYLTRIMLSLTDPAVADLVFDCQKVHSFVMSGFPMVSSSTARSDMNVLYSLDCNDRTATLLVQSDEAPAIHNYRIANARIQPMVMTKNVSGLNDLVQTKPMLTFALFANPTRSEKRTDRPSMRKFIADEAGRMKWLYRHLEACGCRILDAYEESTEAISGMRRSGRINAVGSHWKGTLQVTDPDKFWAAMREGIGHERAYGMGMIMVGRA